MFHFNAYAPFVHEGPGECETFSKSELMDNTVHNTFQVFKVVGEKPLFYHIKGSNSNLQKGNYCIWSPSGHDWTKMSASRDRITIQTKNVQDTKIHQQS